MAIPFALRACLLASAAAGMTACASNPPLPAAAIDYRGDDPDHRMTVEATRPTVLADAARPPAMAASPAPARPAPTTPAGPEPSQRVADLGPSTGTSAVAEARSLAPEAGRRPGGARKLPGDNPSARAVEVLPSDTLYDISRRYSVNMRALIETNALEPPYALDVGGTIFLPPPNIHVVEAGETLYAVSRRYNVDTRSLALLNGIARPFTVWPGDELLLPPLARDQARAPAKPVAVAPPAPVAIAAPPQQRPVLPPPAPARQPVAKSPAPLPTQNGPISLAGTAAMPPAALPPAVAPKPPAPVQTAPAPAQPVKTTPATATGEFIWPVSGKVLKGYGPGSDGSRNDGVNIAANKGADLRAAAGGEVVYAGNELAGFGNLILIRHPGGWVTAYAHCDTVAVNEGDLVRQGQVIGTAGSTGNAGVPQVHFELRKGKEPVDPTRHLPPLQG